MFFESSTTGVHLKNQHSKKWKNTNFPIVLSKVKEGGGSALRSVQTPFGFLKLQVAGIVVLRSHNDVLLDVAFDQTAPVVQWRRAFPPGEEEVRFRVPSGS